MTIMVEIWQQEDRYTIRAVAEISYLDLQSGGREAQ